MGVLDHIASVALSTVVAVTVPVIAQAPIGDITRLAVIGDSVTTGYGVTLNQGWASRLEARQRGGNVLPLAVNGATARRWLQQYLGQLDALRSWQPRTVMIALGANEYHFARPAVEYADHIRQLTEYVRLLAPGASIVYLHYYRINAEFEPWGCDAPPGNSAGCQHANPPDTWDEYGEALRGMAAQQGAVYVDLSMTRDWSALQSSDKAHLTVEGHRIFEHDLYAVLTQ